MQILGTTTLQKGNKMVLLSKIAKKIDTKEGDVIVFYEDEKGDIVIKKG